MAKKMKEAAQAIIKSKPTGNRVEVVATKLHLYTPEGMRRVMSAHKAERLVKKGWVKYA